MQTLLADHCNPETASHMRHDLGLDRPLAVQFVTYITRVSTFDFGTSYVNPGWRVGDIFRQTLPISKRLAALAVMVAAVVGIALGVVAAVSSGRTADRLIQIAVLAGLSVPSFAVAAVLRLFRNPCQA